MDTKILTYYKEKKLNFDIIQTNGNILDNRFFNFLKKNKI